MREHKHEEKGGNDDNDGRENCKEKFLWIVKFSYWDEF